MNLNGLAWRIAQREGKKKQVDIAQIKELLGVIGDICVEDMVAMQIIVNNGVKRHQKKLRVKMKR